MPFDFARNFDDPGIDASPPDWQPPVATRRRYDLVRRAEAVAGITIIAIAAGWIAGYVAALVLLNGWSLRFLGIAP